MSMTPSDCLGIHMFCPGAEGTSVRMRSVIIWWLSACCFTARLWHRAGRRLSPWETVSYKAPTVCHTRTERWKQPSRCVEVCARWISTWNAACGGLSAAFWIAPSLHGSSRECHENQKSWLRDCCSSLSKTRRPRRRRRRRRREMDPARKIRIR